MDGEESGWDMSDHDGNRGDNISSPTHRAPAPRRSNFLEVSGNDITSCSEFSDVPRQSPPHRSTGSLHRHEHPSLSPAAHVGRQPSPRHHISPHSDIESTNFNPERVIFNGHLTWLKIKKGVRQWKNLWAVLRAEKLSLYKNDSEYSAVKIIPLDRVIDAADVDPISRSKVFCFQIITEETIYRFCAPDDEALNQWLGSLKSVLTRYHEAPRHQQSGPAVPGPSLAIR
ncbi:predicted protein [Uncinocarpus reesii 1704]|uniref:PH domain-containing protein n=1 Tax=Uncinocarpus reesii (strain UAMH 1704) TaxID=336963 RepID=C4JRG6_UNCRE|nr:uncharacterized protein UREG_05055 [Uncinocarpus reesii 1704]EEP80213.1 predicted protein [Uncinocarpus reesii 1704]